MTFIRVLLLLAATCSAATGTGTLAAAEHLPQELDSYIATALREWEVPGAAVAIVKDGEVVVARGYGIRELGKPDPANADTIFDTASLTKAFTAAVVASLMDEKKLSWDAPAHQYLSTLEFRDPYLTANVTLRDLLSHRTGVRNNSAWYFTDLTAARVVSLLKLTEAQAPFRTKLVYSNIGYQAAAEVASAAAGATWEKLVTERLLEPLSMTCSTANFDSVPSRGNYASGHAVIAGVHRVVPRETTRMSTAAAGAVQMCAKDLAIWMLFQLGDGTFRGRRILSSEVMEEMHSPQIIVPTTATFRAARQIQHLAAYGLGWQVWDYRGNRLLWHSGGGDGQSAYLALLPDVRLGIALVVNTWRTGGAAFNAGIASRIMDHYLGSPARDYLAEYRDPWVNEQKRAADKLRALEQTRVKNTKPTLQPADYTGVYRDQLGLDVRIVLEARKLSLRYGGGQSATLEHWHADTFRARWTNPLADQERLTFVSFQLDESGRAVALRMNPFDEMINAHRLPP